MCALCCIALVLLLITIFGPGMANLFDPLVVIIAALCLLVLFDQLPEADAEDGPE